MKFFKLYIVILVVFLKTGNVLSEKNLFSVNNIEIANKSNSNNEILANEAIKKGFIDLINRVLLENDAKIIKELKFSEIKKLVSYYQIIEKNEKKGDFIIFNIFFDKDKLHNLFYSKSIAYSDILREDIYVLPILKKGDQFYIYSQNFFYENWNKIEKQDELLEFILPIENIEIIQQINSKSNNFLDVNIKNFFPEYKDKNLALVYIEISDSDLEKIFLKTKIMEKEINKKLVIKKSNLNQEQFYNKVIFEVKSEITNIVKSQNLIDIRTPSFLNTKFKIDKKNNNLYELEKRIKNIDLIENIYVQKFNNEFVFIKIKYLGKVSKIIDLLKNEKINLRFDSDQWRIEII